MKKRNRFVSAVILVFVVLFLSEAHCYSQGEKEEYKKEFGILSGWLDGNLRKQDDCEIVPLYLEIGFDITPNKAKSSGSLKFILEPFFNTIVSPSENVEIGNNFIFKYSHPVIGKFSLYIEGGAGMMYTTLHTLEQGTQFNFTEQLGAGVSYFFAKNKALNLGYRYRHFSNARIKEPNKGVDMDGFLVGISVLY
ncbi:MAG: acyloxyacyl hydrolase [Candidatus Omnitrophica bacterium]|nr:acyloxyacyl hydrolase [Candidatus Omnitrophota bacterium]